MCNFHAYHVGLLCQAAQLVFCCILKSTIRTMLSTIKGCDST
jgi:hypothetical protein